jgi:hypothetical protein
MKKLSFLYSLLMIASLGFLASCGSDEEEPAVGPSINFVGSTGSATANAGDSVEVTILANKGDENLKTLAVTQAGNNYGGFNGGVPKSIDNDKVQETVKLKAPAAGTTSETVFTVTDKDGLSSSVTFKLTANAAATALTEVNAAAKVNNAAGTEPGAFDLETNATVASSGSARDIQDLGLVSGTADWSAKWSTVNGAYIAKVTGVDYATATKEQIVSAFGSSTSTSTGTLVANDLYVVKTSGGNYYLIKIVSVNNTASGNLDNVVFAFKK